MPDIPQVFYQVLNNNAAAGNGTLTAGGPFVFTFMMPNGAVFFQISIPQADMLSIITTAGNATFSQNYAMNSQTGLSNQVFNKQ